VPRTPVPKCTQHSLKKNAHIYMPTHMCIRIHMHKNTRTHLQHIHVHTHKHAWNDSAAATARGADADAGSSARLFLSTQSTTFSTPMLGLHCTHFLRHQYLSTSHPLFPTYPSTVRGPRQARFRCSTLINTTECTTLKKLRAASQWPLA